jgi:iron complex transport system substrate-binding protein
VISLKSLCARLHLRPSFVAACSVLVALLITIAPSTRAEIAVTHNQGQTVLRGTPKTVLVMDFAALETLDTLGIDIAGVPATLIPAHLSKYKDAKYIKIGTLFEPDYETINGAKADLIIVGGRSSPKYKELSRIAPTIDLTTDDSAFLASAFRNARALGQIFGKQDEIEARIAKIEADSRTLREKARDAGRGLIILSTGGRISAYGPRSRFGILHSEFGILPAVEALDTAVHGQAISFELILKANPDWLFVLDRDAAIGQVGQPSAKLLNNPLVARTNAWKQERVIYLDSARWYLIGGGIVSIQQNLDQISRAVAARL